MTDKELIQAFHECERHGVCPSCPLDGDNCPIDEFSAANLIKRMESLLYENEHLREATKMIPKWASVKERLPENECDVLAYRNDGVESRIYAANYANGVWYDCIFNRYDEHTTHWMFLPHPPSTEGVE